jgi:O-antigen/teichoic acid export membrane protein
MSRHSFLRHAAVYSLANILVQASGFVLLPIYIRCLTPEEYGLLEILGRLAETVSTCLLFGGFTQALLTFYNQADHEIERRRVVSTTFALVVLNGVIGGLLVMVLAGPIAGWLDQFMAAQSGSVSPWLVRLAFATILLEPFCLLPLILLQARFRSGFYVTITCAQFLVRVSVCILLVKGLNWGVAGALGATAFTVVCFGSLLTLRELWRGLAWPDWTKVRAMLRFALPLVPGGLCFFILHHGDRFLLLRFASGTEVGTYALGYKLAQVAGTFGLIPLHRVWGVQMYQVARGPDAPGVFGRVFTRILGFYLLVGLGLALFQDEIVAILGSPTYAPAAYVVAPVLLACFCQAAATLMDGGLYVSRRTGLKLGITLATTVVMVVLYALLIPTWKSMGAALATLGGFAFLALLTWLVTRQVFPVDYEWSRLIPVLALTISLWLLSRLVGTGGWALACKLSLWLTWPLVVWHTGLLSAVEKQYVRDLLRHGWTTLAIGFTFRFPSPSTGNSPSRTAPCGPETIEPGSKGTTTDVLLSEECHEDEHLPGRHFHDDPGGAPPSVQPSARTERSTRRRGRRRLGLGSG